MANPSNSPKAVKRKKFIRKTVAVIAVVVLIITGAALFFRRRVQEKFSGGSTDTVLSAQVKTGSIHTTVSGTGSLTGEGIVDVEVPDLVPLDTVYVVAGDAVKAGDVLASVKAGPACIRRRTGAAEGTPRPWYCHRFYVERRHDRQEGSRAERRRRSSRIRLVREV